MSRIKDKFLENMKFLGKYRSAQIRERKRNNIARLFRGGTPPRVKTIRRYRKQQMMGLSMLRKEVVVDGLARYPTKARAVFPAKKVPHPNEDARKVGAPYYIVDRG